MEIKVFTNTDLFQTNAFLIVKDKKAILVDVAGKADEIIDFLKANDLELTNILLTHGHFNHIMGIEKLKLAYPLSKIVIGQKDVIGLYDQSANRSSDCDLDFRLKKEVSELITINKDSLIGLSGIEFKILMVGCYTKGSLIFKMTNENIIFCGDVIYLDQIKNPWTQIKKFSKIKTKKAIRYIYNNFSDDCLVYPGHGEVGFTLADVKEKNVAANKLVRFKQKTE